MTELESIAADLRDKYWASVGESRGPWETASPESKRAWADVAELARERWERRADA